MVNCMYIKCCEQSYMHMNTIIMACRKRARKREHKKIESNNNARTTAGKITINLNVPAYALNRRQRRMLNPDVMMYHNDVISLFTAIRFFFLNYDIFFFFSTILQL